MERINPQTSTEAYKKTTKEWYGIMRAYSKRNPDKLLFKYIEVLLDLKIKDEAKYLYVIEYMGLDGGVPVWRNTSLANLKDEYWKKIPKYPNYQASSLGRFKSVARVVKDTVGRKRPIKERILPQSFDPSGYLRFCVHVRGKQTSPISSRLLGISFLKNPRRKTEVNHKIGIKPFNPIWNLEWSTPSENQIHAFENRLQVSQKGQINGMASISNETALKIFKDTRTAKEVAKHFMVRVSIVTRIRSGELWSSVTGKKHIPTKISNECVMGVFNSNLPVNEICRAFNVTEKQVYGIKRGITWGQLTGKLYIPNKNYFKNGRKKTA